MVTTTKYVKLTPSLIHLIERMAETHHQAAGRIVDELENHPNVTSPTSTEAQRLKAAREDLHGQALINSALARAIPAHEVEAARLNDLAVQMPWDLKPKDQPRSEQRNATKPRLADIISNEQPIVSLDPDDTEALVQLVALGRNAADGLVNMNAHDFLEAGYDNEDFQTFIELLNAGSRILPQLQTHNESVATPWVAHRI